MQQADVENILLKIIKIGIFVVLLTPLVLGPFGINLVEYPKAVFFRSLVEVIFALYIALILLNKTYLPQKSILLASLLLFYTVMIVASIFGVNFYTSFFGDMIRGEGLILHLHLLAFFIIITSVFLKKEEWLNLFKASVLISGLSSIIALLQQLKLGSFYGMYLPRLSGTMSNPDLFACYIVLSIFVTIFLLAVEDKRNFKILWSFLIVLNCYTLIFSNTRGSWLGFIIGLFSLALFNFFRLSRKNKILLFFAVLIFCILILLFFLNLHWLKNIGAGSMVDKIMNKLNDLNGRIEIWSAASAAIKERPILGWGFESFTFVSDKYMRGLGNGLYFDRAHNKVLEVLVYGGIIGFAAYFLIFAVIFYLIFKYAKLWDGYNNRPKIIYASILAAFFIAYFVQNIFAFDNIGTYILFFLVAGFINNNFSGPPVLIHKKSPSSYKEYDPILTFKIIIIFFAFLFTAWVIYEVNLKPTIAGMYFPSLVIYENTDLQKALSGYEKGIGMNTIYDDDLRMAFTDRMLYLLDNGFVNNYRENIYDDLLKIKPFLYKEVANNGGQINHLYQFLARIDEQEYLQDKNINSLNEMEQVLSRAMSFNPNVAASCQLMGELKILQNNYSEGEKYIEKSCILDGSDDAMLYERTGSAYLKKGDIGLALKDFEKVIDINYDRKKQVPESAETSLLNAKIIDYVARMYYEKLNDLQDCRRIYEEGSEIYPQYANAFKQNLEKITADSNKQQK